MFQILLELFYSWLPAPLWLGVNAVIGVAFLIIMIKILSVLLNFVTKIIGMFIP